MKKNIKAGNEFAVSNLAMNKYDICFTDPAPGVVQSFQPTPSFILERAYFVSRLVRPFLWWCICASSSSSLATYSPPTLCCVLNVHLGSSPALPPRASSHSPLTWPPSRSLSTIKYPRQRWAFHYLSANFSAMEQVVEHLTTSWNLNANEKAHRALLTTSMWGVQNAPQKYPG